MNYLKKKRKNTGQGLFILAMAILLLVGVTAITAAQNQPADNMQVLLEKIKADKRLIVSENMELTETEAKAFWPVYDAYQNELFLIRTRMAKLIKDYADAYEKMTNAAAKNLMNESMAIEALGLKLRQAYLPKFRKVLPETKVVRYYQIENKLYALLLYELAGKIPMIKTDNK